MHALALPSMLKVQVCLLAENSGKCVWVIVCSAKCTAYSGVATMGPMNPAHTILIVMETIHIWGDHNIFKLALL